MSIAGGLENALLDARRKRCGCVQLFVANQRQWRHPPLTEEQIEVFHRTRQSARLDPVIAHSSYLINPAAPDADIYKRGVAALADEYDRCGRLGIDYLVFHPGSHKGSGLQKGILRVVEAIKKVLDKHDNPCRLLVETTAGQGDSVGCRFEHLAEILGRVKSPDRLGVCLDTCHVFAAGYELRTKGGCKQTFKIFDDIVGCENLKVIHANDTKTDFNSGVDRHEHIGKGKLGREAFRNLLADRRLRKLPFILETPKGKSPGGRDYDMLNLAMLRRLAR